MRLIFAGTPLISKIVLTKLLDSGFDIGLVLTQPDRPAGRGKKIIHSQVKEFALERQIKVLQPVSFKKNTQILEEIRYFRPDIIILVAYGLILPQELLDIAPCINAHVSLLPAWRGAAPIQRAIIAGDKYSGVTIMQMDNGLDTGDILLQQDVLLDEAETSQTLHNKLANLGAELLIKYLHNPNSYVPIKQSNIAVSYAHKITKSETQINWHEEATIIERKIRGFNPCFSYLNGKIIKIWHSQVIDGLNSKPCGTIIDTKNNQIQVSCGNQTILAITKLQMEGKNIVTSRDFVLGRDNLINKCFENSILK